MWSTVLLVMLAAVARAQRTVAILDDGWKFLLDDGGAKPNCSNPATAFPVSFDGKQCLGLEQQLQADSLQSCIDACCGSAGCEVYQWCPANASCSPSPSCWTGPLSGGCSGGQTGWQSRGRSPPPPPSPPPTPGSQCTDPWCSPATDDSAWRTVNVPHDFVVEGNFSSSADMSHGYLPYGVGWYRKRFTPPASLAGAPFISIDFEGVQTKSTVFLNGKFLGQWGYGYTNSRYLLTSTDLYFGQENLLAVQVDCTQPDGWWYDGGGIYRHVVFTAVVSPGPAIAPWGVYVPSNVTGAITWDASGAPFADSAVWPSVELWNNASSAAAQSFTVTVSLVAANGAVVATATGSGAVAGQGGVAVWSPAAMLVPGAALWHLVSLPAKPALYTCVVVLAVGGRLVDTHNVTFGIRSTFWDGATGFWLNGVITKILGNANHQDFAAVGVAVPDHLQWYRVAKLKQFGSNGWRTAHNPPTPALLDAMDELGFVSWDENHRNGQLDQVPLLIKRDRNHPSVVIWSICNEVLCNTNDSPGDALTMKALMHSLDPLSGRPVSANQNGYVGPSTPLDVQGFDYNTGNYDNWHNQAPHIPSISSETSSAVSDRGEYANNATAGHVSGYDNVYPGWGESAEQAWGGVGESAGQGIFTRAFISGGWTWTGWDYRGEPTPYSWPDVNSHFGIVDLCGFEKDRTHWYASWFPTINGPAPAVPHLHVFPHWNWQAGDKVDVWAFSAADSVELFVNGVSLGAQNMTKFSHVQWLQVPFVPGSLRVEAMVAGKVVATDIRNTTGAPAALRISIRDGVGAPLYAGCQDSALVMIEVVDDNGLVVPYADNAVSFALAGTPSAKLEGTCNGDPAGHTNNKDTVRAAFHGLVLAVVDGGVDAGTLIVSASSPGLTPATLSIPVLPGAAVAGAVKWCRSEPRW